MDSCSVMRGEKSRHETRVCEVAPHLIDGDGDSCRHIHNFVKKMTFHFRYYLEWLFCDIYHDFQHSASLLKILEGMALHFGLSSCCPSNYAVTCTNNDVSELSKSGLSKLQDKTFTKTASEPAKGKECKNGIIA